MFKKLLEIAGTLAGVLTIIIVIYLPALLNQVPEVKHFLLPFAVGGLAIALSVVLTTFVVYRKRVSNQNN